MFLLILVAEEQLCTGAAVEVARLSLPQHPAATHLRAGGAASSGQPSSAPPVRTGRTRPPTARHDRPRLLLRTQSYPDPPRARVRSQITRGQTADNIFSSPLFLCYMHTIWSPQQMNNYTILIVMKPNLRQ